MKKLTRKEFFKAAYKTLTFLAIPGLFSKCSSAEDEIIGPYLQNVKQTKATVCWLEKEGEDFDLMEGLYNITNQRVKPIFNNDSSMNDRLIKKIEMTNLEPGKTYEYDLGNGTRKFRTKPNIREPFSFLVYGDSHGGPYSDKHRKIIKQMKEHDCSFVIHLGDLVDEGHIYGFWEDFLRDIEPISGRAPYYPIIGNHDVGSKYYSEFFSLPGKEKYYTFEWGDCRFAVLNSTELIDNPSGKNSKEQLDMLDKEIKPDKINFLLTHHPVLFEDGLKNILQGKLDNFQIILSGHYHLYKKEYIGKLMQIVSGGGGGKLSTNLNKYHFIKVDVGKTLDFNVISDKGDFIDKFSLENKFWDNQ